MIHCDRIDGKLIFSDDRALMPVGFNDYIQEWLGKPQPNRHILLREPVKYDPNYSGVLEVMPTFAMRETCLELRLWQMDNMQRVFRAAICLEREWQILGPEIHPRHGHIIDKSPVADIIIRHADAPPPSMQEIAKRAAEVWATLSDDERARHSRIGQVADLLDLDSLTR